MRNRDTRGTTRGTAVRCLLYVLALTAIAAVVPASAPALGASSASWGENYHGQLGAIYRNKREVGAIGVEGLNNVVSVVAANSFNLALLSDGTVASWGGNSYGQLGNNGFKANWELGQPHVMVSGLTGVKQIAGANEHALALMQDGTVRAWGNNQYGQLGNGRGGFEEATGENQRLPKVVEGLTGVKAIESGGGANFALLNNGTVMAWGSNTKGQLGIEWPVECQNRRTPGCEAFECIGETGAELCSTRPHLVVTATETPLTEVVAISAGQEAAYALLKNGTVVSWGGNGRGQLGQGETASTKFVPPGYVITNTGEVLKNVVEVSGGMNHALARLKTGRVRGWGDAEKGGLGKEPKKPACGKTLCYRTAILIKALTVKAEAVAAGSRFSLALSSHEVYAFGRNEDGELGNGTTLNSATPAVVPGIGHVTSISAANTHVLALLESGVQPPPPVLTVTPESGAMTLVWTTNAAERLLYREFERPGLLETEEEAGEGGGGEGGPGPPHNTTRPRIKGEAREGQALEATTGNWTGTEPIEFAYQWQRCTGKSECTDIPEAIAARYEAGAEDVKDTLRIVITATNSVEPPGTAASEPTEVVKSEEEGRRSKGQSIKLLEGQQSVRVNEFHEKTPLETVPFELKFRAAKVSRTMVATPLP